jgi:hypothetical protein
MEESDERRRRRRGSEREREPRTAITAMGKCSVTPGFSFDTKTIPLDHAP